MRKNIFYRSITVFAVLSVAAGCVDEKIVSNRPELEEGEILFGASASFDDGDPKTKTEYGDVSSDRKYIELNWVLGDKVIIACPQAVQSKIANYTIGDSVSGGDYPTEGGKGVSNAQYLIKESVGLQWNAVGMDHRFCAMYPAPSSFSESERGQINLGTDGVTGYMPVNQNPKSIEVSGSNYMVKPDMRYAFMVADTTHTHTGAENESVNLRFKPLVTALEFDITCGEIGTQQVGGVVGESAIRVISVSLHSASEQPICGHFNYKFNTGEVTEANGGVTGYSRITMSFDGLPGYENGVLLTEGNKLDVTFFVLPVDDFAAGDLKLDIIYTLNGSPFVKTATVNRDIQAKKKYYFKNMAMPSIPADVSGSRWFSAIDDAVLVSQLSIPVAGNAFSNGYTGTDEHYYKEQVVTYDNLWNLGVRGFEFCTASKGTSDGTADISGLPFICNATELGGDNLGTAFSKLVAKMDEEDADGNKPYEAECLIAIFKYTSYGESGYDPSIYCQQVCKFLEPYAERLAVLNASTTVGDIRGKIVALIRPADDAYMTHAGKGTSKDIDISSSSVADKVTIIQDWGSCVDRWDRRYSGYAAEGAFAQSGELVFEDLLWGECDADNTESGFTYNSTYAGNDLNSAITYPDETLNLFHTLTIGSNTNAGRAMISDLLRVVPRQSSFTKAFYSGVSVRYRQYFWNDYTYRYLWLKWPESMTTKLRMLQSVFNASTASIGSASDDIFIQNLCGFYMTSSFKESNLPYNGKNYVSSLSNNIYSLSDPGKGGNYSAHAADFNTAFYNFLKAEEDKGSAGIQGPWGLVMMDYIGASSSDFTGLDEYLGEGLTHATAAEAATASTALPRLIIMNNFKFPLATATDPASQNYDTETTDGGNAIDFNP